MAETEKTSFRASHRYARISSRKVGLVLPLVRRQPVNEALLRLRYCSKRAARLVDKVIRSAMANASQAGDVDLERLIVARAVANEGPLVGRRMRYRPASLGRAAPIRRRSSHIEIVLDLAAPPAETAAPRRARRPRAARAAERPEPPAAAPDRGEASGSGESSGTTEKSEG